MTDDHRRTEMSAIMEWFLIYTLERIVSSLCRLTPCLGEGTHWLGKTMEGRQIECNIAGKMTYSRKVLVALKFRADEV